MIRTLKQIAGIHAVAARELRAAAANLSAAALVYAGRRDTEHAADLYRRAHDLECLAAQHDAGTGPLEG